MLLKGLKKIRASERGAALPMMCAGLIAMAASIGSAIDLGRIYMTRTQLQAGVDAAALAGARAFGNTTANDRNNRDTQTKAYFLGNFPNGYMGSGKPDDITPVDGTTSLLPAQFVVNNGINQTVVTAKAKLPMLFMSIFGMQPINVTAIARAELQPRPLEVMVVLDNTGSMNSTVDGVTKISALKNAMHSFLNVLYQGSSTRQDLALGIVNYTITANVGQILKDSGVQIEDMAGFTDKNWAAGDPYGWKGCVQGDDTVVDMASTVSAADANAFDLYNDLPGDGVRRTGQTRTMHKIRPFLYPPAYFPKNGGASKTDQTSDYYKVSNATITASGSTTSNNNGDNLYPATTDPNFSTIANSSLYKRYFYRLFIGLNDGVGTAADDVVTASDGGYWDPSRYNSFTNAGDTNFVIQADRITERNPIQWHAPALWKISSSNTQYPSPNWQCPEPGMAIQYGRSKSTYDSYVDDRVWGIYPANGTMHHIGFIWGYRLLSRFDVFQRTKPAGTSTPKRALVFMTDGESALSVNSGASDKTWTAYGTPDDRRLTTGSGLAAAVDRRFTKACAIANSQMLSDGTDPPPIYIVAINRGSDLSSAAQTMLRNCGSGGFWLTTSADGLNQAFTSIAADLVDLHLTQ